MVDIISSTCLCSTQAHIRAMLVGFGYRVLKVIYRVKGLPREDHLKISELEEVGSQKLKENGATGLTGERYEETLNSFQVGIS